jgi:lysophospholipase
MNAYTALARRRALPAGGERVWLTMRDGWRVRGEIWPGGNGGSSGTVLLMGGRGDFVEKYCEALHDLVDAGFAVASFDWRGQGLSGRLAANPMQGHCDSFEPWVADIGEIAVWLSERSPGRQFAIGHSMGGHLLLRHLGEDGRFDRAVLLSPMLGLVAPPLGPWATRWLALAIVAAGGARRWVPGGGAYVPAAAGSPRQRMLTSDADRYPDEPWWIAACPELAMGAPSWGWLDAAFASLARLAPARVTTPLLVLTPERDALVDVAATRRMAALVPGARLVAIAGAGHELLRESDAIRARVLGDITGFLKGAD